MNVYETLERIRLLCSDNPYCEGCPFVHLKGSESLIRKECSINDLTSELNHIPQNWDMEKIKGILDRE